jgi:protein-S-isoprenylcysteine O-methyltransferase Ste14
MNLLNRYLYMKVNRRALLEWSTLIISGILANKFSLLLISNHFLIIGIILFITGIFIHILSHIKHPQAHKEVKEINYIVTTGIYSKIRHPGYLGIILAYLGMGLFLRNLVSIVLAFIFSLLLGITALKEEEELSRNFKEYEEYKKKVKWRFIPKIF